MYQISRPVENFIESGSRNRLRPMVALIQKEREYGGGDSKGTMCGTETRDRAKKPSQIYPH